MTDVKEKTRFYKLSGHLIDTTVTEPTGPVKGTALFLHGAGESTKHRCLPLARQLSRHGWRCITFSAPGHGDSSGELLGSSLQERLNIARQLIQELKLPDDSLLLGISMGAHTAISLLEYYPDKFNRLVLMVPAIYSRAAETAPFGPQFSKIIRQPGSYIDSACWTLLDNYTGQLAVVRTGQDQVIPDDIYKLIRQNSRRAAHRQFVTIKDSPHRISVWIEERPALLAATAKALHDFNFSAVR